VKMGPNETEAEARGDPTSKADNEVWTHLHRNPKGRGQFSPSRCRSSLQQLITVRSLLLDLRKTVSRRSPSQ
jgi:hypothetical protein